LRPVGCIPEDIFKTFQRIAAHGYKYQFSFFVIELQPPQPTLTFRSTKPPGQGQPQEKAEARFHHGGQTFNILHIYVYKWSFLNLPLIPALFHNAPRAFHLYNADSSRSILMP
jgi:hypothetical protein